MATKYKCDFCNYMTSRKYDFTRHCNSQAHVQNTKFLTPQMPAYASNSKKNVSNANKYFCKKCNASFGHRQSLWKHTKSRCLGPTIRQPNKVLPSAEKVKSIISLPPIVISVDNPELIKEIQRLKKRESNLEKTNANLIETIKNQSISVKNTSETAKKSVNAMTFLNAKYPNAPPIAFLENNDDLAKMTKEIYEKQNNISKSDHLFEEIIIFHFKKDTLPKLMGDVIVNMYKKDQSKEQSIWNSDVSRLTFVIKNLINNTTDSVWIKDCKGLQVKNMIIKPMMNIVREKMTTYVNEGHDYVDEKTLERNLSNDDEEKIKSLLLNMTNATKLIQTILLGKIHDDIVRYIAPHFNLGIKD